MAYSNNTTNILETDIVAAVVRNYINGIKLLIHGHYTESWLGLLAVYFLQFTVILGGQIIDLDSSLASLAIHDH